MVTKRNPDDERLSVLILIDWYCPSTAANGTTRLVDGMVARLGNDVFFSIITQDRGRSQTTSCPRMKPGQWSPFHNSRVFSLAPQGLSLPQLRTLLNDVNPDVVYLTSFFSPLTRKFLIWRKMKLIPNIPCVLGPSGEFSPGALRIKSLRKRAYILGVSRMGLYDDLVWHASWSGEERDIRAAWPRPIKVRIAPALTPSPCTSPEIRNLQKSPFTVRFVFLSRISPMKNLRYAIELLGELRGQVLFDIYGPLEDSDYWATCLRSIQKLPRHITVRSLGSVDNSKVVDTLRDYHFFLMPTLGENFGYAIFEALAAGCPPIISDRTPWNTLREHGVGWDIPLQDQEQWRRVLQDCVDMPNARYRQMAEAAQAFARDWSTSSRDIRQNFDLFRDAVSTAHDSKLH